MESDFFWVSFWVFAGAIFLIDALRDMHKERLKAELQKERIRAEKVAKE